MDRKRVTQIGILVADIEAASAEWAQFTGQASEIFLTEPYEVTGATYRGQPCYGRLKQAFFNLDNVQIELISPFGDEPSVWRDCLEKNGEGLHHLAFMTDQMDEDVHVLEKKGLRVMQSGHWPAEPVDGTYVYLDGRNSLKTIVELLATK